MATLAFPGQFQGGFTTGYLSIGAVQKAGSDNLAFPGTFPGELTVGYLNIGAVQKQVVTPQTREEYIIIFG